MRSPLEYEPELVAGMGLITVRWAALEMGLADLFGSVLKIEPMGERGYYSISNFSQRIDLVETVVVGSLKEGIAKRASKSLFEKIRRLWKTRNYLVHSHYVYSSRSASGFGPTLIGVGKDLGEHPAKRWYIRREDEIVYNEDGSIAYTVERTLEQGFAYQKRGKRPVPEYVFVNKGTFNNHAEQVSKRMRQVRLLKKSIQTMSAPLNWGSSAGASHTTYSPRAGRNLQEYLTLLARRNRPSRP